MQVKICGVRDDVCARACVDAAVELVGFNFVASSKRFIPPYEARNLVDIVGAERAVGVFRNQSEQEIRKAAEQSGVTWAQLHGSETPSLCEALRSSGLRVIKAIAVTRETKVDSMTDYIECTELRLLDAARPGSGESFDYALLRKLDPPRPYFLAGGLNPDNVGAAIERVRPDGVDTASGVERDGRDGRMDPARVLAFCRAAREVRLS